MTDTTPFPAELKDIMIRLQGEYVQRINAHLPSVREMAEKAQAGALSSHDMAQLDRMAHDFAGSGATFGFPDVSKTARDLHIVLRTAIEHNESAVAQMPRDVVAGHAVALVAALSAAAGLSRQEAEKQLVLPTGLPPAAERDTRDIYFVGNNTWKADVAALTGQLHHFGYRVIVNAEEDTVRAAITRRDIRALVAFSDLSPPEMARLKAMCGDNLKQGELSVPFIAVVPDGAFETRQHAAQLGAQGFFVNTVDALKLIEKIEQLAVKFAAPPHYKVMIVDDDKMLAEFYTYTLTQGGMSVMTLDDPRQAVEALDRQQSDLILIDFYMPGCNGQELATIIRQHERYVSLPIVFISAYEDLQKALIDTALGIDDFLVKPFTAERLFSVVRSRAQRAAELRAFMTRDSFTGLFNHAHFNEQLENELARVKRRGHETAYVTLDLDKFKSINDNYGHAAGDMVIKSIARMLQQRLRRSDVVGRCGGEEFGIILPECSLEKAEEIMEEIRVAFAGTYFVFGGTQVHVTFSAGLVRIDPQTDIDQLMKDADARLYKAKNMGRNRIVAG